MDSVVIFRPIKFIFSGAEKLILLRPTSGGTWKKTHKQSAQQMTSRSVQRSYFTVTTKAFSCHDLCKILCSDSIFVTLAKPTSQHATGAKGRISRGDVITIAFGFLSLSQLSWDEEVVKPILTFCCWRSSAIRLNSGLVCGTSLQQFLISSC